MPWWCTPFQLLLCHWWCWEQEFGTGEQDRRTGIWNKRRQRLSEADTSRGSEKSWAIASQLLFLTHKQGRISSPEMGLASFVCLKILEAWQKSCLSDVRRDRFQISGQTGYMMVPEWTLLGDGRKFSVTSGARSMDDTFVSHASCSTLCFLSISGGVWGCGCDSENVHSVHRPFWAEHLFMWFWRDWTWWARWPCSSSLYAALSWLHQWHKYAINNTIYSSAAFT